MISVAQRGREEVVAKHIPHRHAVQTQICRRHYPLRSVDEEGMEAEWLRNVHQEFRSQDPSPLSFLLYFIFISCVCQCLHAHMCTMSVSWRQEETSDLLELELQAVVSLLVWTMETQVFGKSSLCS